MPRTTEPSLIELADAAFRQAATEVIRRARQHGTRIIVWENGRICAITPDEAQKRMAGGPAAPAPHRSG
jgi:hypothetical protein